MLTPLSMLDTMVSSLPLRGSFALSWISPISEAMLITRRLGMVSCACSQKVFLKQQSPGCLKYQNIGDRYMVTRKLEINSRTSF